MDGCISEFTSRRINFEKCKYWNRKESKLDLEQYVYENAPSGHFYAKEITAQTLQKNIIGNTFMFDQNTIALETSDVVNIVSGDIVEYDNELWVVNNVQYDEIHKNKQFMKTSYKKTYIQMRR